MRSFLLNPYVSGALTGLAAAALVDYRAFRAWKSWDDATHYDWRTASFRWAQGLAAGLLASLGFQTIQGF